MIKIKYKTINDKKFMEAIVHLSTLSGFENAEAAYNVTRILRQIMQVLKTTREEYAEMVKPFLVKDDKGNYKLLEKPELMCPFEIIDGKKEELKTLIEEFLQKEATLESHPLTLKSLNKVDLSPSQIIDLEPIFDISQQ